MQNKTILILLDGLNQKVGFEQLGYLNHLVEHSQATRLKGCAETPSNSRPNYEIIHTGIPTYKNGITNNYSNQPSKETNIFSIVKENGGKTGAAAYHWFSELYNSSPFNPFTDRMQFNSGKAIDFGIFYYEDHYPDSHLYADANYIISTEQPDYMLVHSMNIDDAGHKHGATSMEYNIAANAADVILASMIPKWRDLGYDIVVTSDHGMDEFGLHGGTLETHRATPLFILSDKIKKGFLDNEVSHLQLSSILLYLLGLKTELTIKELLYDHLD